MSTKPTPGQILELNQAVSTVKNASELLLLSGVSAAAVVSALANELGRQLRKIDDREDRAVTARNMADHLEYVANQ